MQPISESNLVFDLRREILKKDNDIARLNIKVASQSMTIDTLHEDIFALIDQRDEDAIKILQLKKEIVRMEKNFLEYNNLL